jgi:hypothetical protein
VLTALGILARDKQLGCWKDAISKSTKSNASARNRIVSKKWTLG